MENLKEMTFDESKSINGGFILEVIAAAGGLLYCYEWGYDYAYRRTH